MACVTDTAGGPAYSLSSHIALYAEVLSAPHVLLAQPVHGVEQIDYLEVTVPGAVLSQPPAGVHCQLSSLLPLQETGFRDMPYVVSLNCPVQLSPTCPQQGLLITLLVLASSCQHLMSPLPYQGFFGDHLPNQLFVTMMSASGTSCA